MTHEEYRAALDQLARDESAALRRARNAAQRAAIRSECSQRRDSLAYLFTRSSQTI